MVTACDSLEERTKSWIASGSPFSVLHILEKVKSF